MGPVMRTIVVDDHPLFRAGLAQLIDSHPDYKVIAAVGTAGEALDVARTQEFELAIVDLVLPVTGGVSLTKRLKDIAPTCKVLGLSAHDAPVRVAAMVRAGADGFALKSQSSSDILDALHCVAESRQYLPPTLDAGEVTQLAKSDDVNPLERLTARELEVFQRLIGGASNETVATELDISRRTVETHRQNLMRKLNVTSFPQLLVLAYSLGL